ncbi:hypothetical protein IWZ01DRAFT_541403 [Phyllosticta capitalensis]
MAPSLHKIIVGLDYGTTYSGVSYVTSNADSFEKIEVINQWPGTSDVASKVPTRIAYESENNEMGFDKWGYTVSAAHESYSWTKLLLDKSTILTGFDDPSLRDLMGSGMMRLPAHKSAQQVCNDFLAELYRHVVKSCVGSRYLQFDAARDATKSAALAAGFGSRKMDTVNIITEPEAAALKPHLNPQCIDPIRAGDNVLVCDCGGGTVDITTYQIVEAHPRLSFKEICVGMGGNVGSTYIDRNFNQWLINTFGNAYTSIPAKKRGPGSALMRSFETAKRTFSSEADDENDATIIEIEHLCMKAPSSSRFDEEEETLKLTYGEMREFFAPVLRDISRLMDEQVDHAKSLGNDIDRVILVGGFGDSDFLVGYIKSWCRGQRPKRPKLLCPPQSQAAIVKGAALRGLEDLKPMSRIARRHYGFECAEAFREGIDPEHLSRIDDWSGEKYCDDRMTWGIHKGQTIDQDTETEVPVFLAVTGTLTGDQRIDRTTIYSCSHDDAPEYSFEDGIQRLGTVITEFSRAEILKAPKRKSGRKTIRKLEYDIKVSFSADEGAVVFATYIDGKQAGRTKVEFHND